MAVTKTTVQFGDALGYDDFPTEIKFVVDLEHCKPRDNAFIENMFNGTKGRFYSFTDGDILKAYNTINSMNKTFFTKIILCYFFLYSIYLLNTGIIGLDKFLGKSSILKNLNSSISPSLFV